MQNIAELASTLDQTRCQNPLVHCITNYVTVNDCANIILAAGGSPIMADDIREAEQIAGLCSALVLNIGTLNARTTEAMLAAGKRPTRWGGLWFWTLLARGPRICAMKPCNDFCRKCALPPSRATVRKSVFWRTAWVRPGEWTRRQGLWQGKTTLAAKVRQARELSKRCGAVIVISGPIDILADSRQAWAVRNGNPLMAWITGSGCMTAAVMGCCLGARPKETSAEDALRACLCAVCALGVCGELAAERMACGGNQGTGTYRMLLMDAMSALDGKTLAARARVEQR